METISDLIYSFKEYYDPEIGSNIAIISPKNAQRLMAYNRKNRSLSKPTVEKYAKALKEGKWQVNGVPIIVSDTDWVLDGQHRLQACILAGVPLTTAITWGIRQEAIRTVDVGKKRNDADFLTMEEFKSASTVATTFAQAYAYNNRRLDPKGFAILTLINQIETATDFFNRMGFVDIKDAVKEGRKYEKYAKHNGLKGSRLAGIHLSLTSRNTTSKKIASSFIKKIATGLQCSGDDPIFHANKFCESFKTNLDGKKKSISYLQVPQKIAIMIHTWNLFVTGKRIKTVATYTKLLRNELKFTEMVKPTVDLYVDKEGCIQRNIY